MDELDRLKITIQNRLNEARNRADGVARVMNTTLSQMLKVVNETLEKRKDQPIKKWYVYSRSAEDCGYFTVLLSKNEHAIIEKFISAQDNGPDEGYSGDFSELRDGPFDTQLDAIKYLVKQSYPYSYVKNMTDEELTNIAKEYIKEDKQNEGNN